MLQQSLRLKSGYSCAIYPAILFNQLKVFRVLWMNPIFVASIYGLAGTRMIFFQKETAIMTLTLNHSYQASL